MVKTKELYKIFLFFILSYMVILPIWLNVNFIYNKSITNLAFKIACWKYDFTIVKSKIDGKDIIYDIKNRINIRDTANKERKISANIVMIIEWVTRNVPMTLSLLLAIIFTYAYKKFWYPFLYGVVALIGLHIFTLIIISFGVIISASFQSPLMHFYISRYSMPTEILYYIGTFLGNYAYLFEPFLISFIAWLNLSKNKSL